MKNLIAHSDGCSTNMELLNEPFKTVTITYCPECFKYVRTEVNCDHTFEPVAFTVSNGSVQVRMHCTKCNSITAKSESHSNFDMLKLKKAKMDDYRTFWDNKCKQESDKIKEFTTVLNEQAHRFNQSGYNEYLKSEWWQSIRPKALERDNYTCQICGGKAIDVHHMTYIHRGHEYLFELVSFCKKCHLDYHVQLNKAQ